MDLKCSDYGKTITEKVLKYSAEHYNKELGLK